MLAWRNRPNAVDLYQIIRDALLDSPQSGGEAPQSGLPTLRQKGGVRAAGWRRFPATPSALCGVVVGTPAR
jgi:hypothetical protein